MFNRTRAAWHYFIPKVKSICQMFSTIELPLKVADIVFSKSFIIRQLLHRNDLYAIGVVGVELDFKSSIFDRKGNPDATPCEVEFLEIEDPLEGEPWGEWLTKNMEGACITDIRWSSPDSTPHLL